MERKLQAFSRLLAIMDKLRLECPWDKKQTIDSLRYLTIEETYELSDAILKKDMNEIKKELGDLFLHIVFYSKIASETNDFDITDVINNISDKLVHRHPHIYSNVLAANAKEVKKNWEKLKLEEGSKSVLEGLPLSLPPLVKAYRIQEKVSGIGFDWNYKEKVWQKVKEEIEELSHEIEKKNQDRIESELGDVLFSLINYARHININADNALEKANKRFIERFQIMEELIHNDKKSIDDMNLQEMDEYWEKAKLIFLKK